jgi:hypothetical protein
MCSKIPRNDLSEAKLFHEEDYTMGEEVYGLVDATKSGCKWVGCLYHRKDGGFDLYYDHEGTEFNPLPVDKITMLRHMAEADNGLVFIARLDEETSELKLLKNAEKNLLLWIDATIGG